MKSLITSETLITSEIHLKHLVVTSLIIPIQFGQGPLNVAYYNLISKKGFKILQ